MGIIRPIDMPNPAPINAVTFALTPVQQLTPTGSGSGGGFIQTVDRASPMWIAKYTTNPLSTLVGVGGTSAYQRFISWLDQLEGANNAFYGFHPRFTVPSAFASQLPGALTSEPWGPGGSVTGNNYADPSVIINNIPQGTLTLEGLVSGTTFAAGDFIQYNNGWMTALYRVTTASVISGSMANKAWTMTDNSATVTQGDQQSITIPNDNQLYTIRTLLAKTTGGTSKTVAIIASLTGGSSVGANTRINTDTGVDLNNFSTVKSNGALFWLVETPIQNNNSGNTTLTVNICPAIAPNNSTVDAVSTTGSAIVYECHVSPSSVWQNSNTFNGAGWTSTLGTLAQNATGPGASGKVAVRPRPQDAIGTSHPKIRLAKASCAMKMIGSPQWTDTVDGLPYCTWNAVQYIERGTP